MDNLNDSEQAGLDTEEVIFFNVHIYSLVLICRSTRVGGSSD